MNKYTEDEYITRKDIAQILAHRNVSVDMVRKNEHAWGLRKYRHDLNARVIQYHYAGVMRELKKRGLLEKLPCLPDGDHTE